MTSHPPKAHFTGKDDPFHLLGPGVCALRSVWRAASWQKPPACSRSPRPVPDSRRSSKTAPTPTRKGKQPLFPSALAWKTLCADAVVLLGLTNTTHPNSPAHP